MGLRVVVPPEPIVTPADIAGSHAADDVRVKAMIAAVTAKIDGPRGWLGRALGRQELELSLPSFGCDRAISLPCRPVVSISSVKYIDPAGAEQTVADAAYRRAGETMLWFAPSFSIPATIFALDAVKIRYVAGYDGDPADDGTGAVPEEARVAIIVSVQHLLSVGKPDLFLRAHKTEGVGETQWTVTDQAGKVVEDTCNNLLSGLWLPKL